MQLLPRPVQLSKVKHSSSTTHDPAALLRLSNASSENFLKIHIPVVTAALLGQLKQASADECQTKLACQGAGRGNEGWYHISLCTCMKFPENRDI